MTPTGYSLAFNWGVIDNVKIYGYTKPNMPVIKGKTSINLDESYEISVSATDIDNDKIS